MKKDHTKPWFVMNHRLFQTDGVYPRWIDRILTKIEDDFGKEGESIGTKMGIEYVKVFDVRVYIFTIGKMDSKTGDLRRSLHLYLHRKCHSLLCLFFTAAGSTGRIGWYIRGCRVGLMTGGQGLVDGHGGRQGGTVKREGL